jgi:peptidoglycan/xylan/chitin deacetylase (PgdA/CDA1 family)
MAAFRLARCAVPIALLLACAWASAQVEPRGAIARGPLAPQGTAAPGRIALLFTGHEFAEGGHLILDQLKQRGARASFFLTGDFLRNPGFAPLVRRIVAEGHYLGPHSDKHLLYCGWEASRPTLVTREVFRRDLEDNLREVERFSVPRATVRYWVPAYEWFNDDIVRWSEEIGLRVLDFTRGTRGNADYTGEADPKFVSSEAIVASILARERQPDGLDGFLLLMHIGAGPGRRDKMHDRLGGLLDDLARRGYAFVRADEMIDKKPRN